MESNERRRIATFPSIHFVLAAERILQGRGLWCDLVPTPKALTSDCGMCLEFRDDTMSRSLLQDPRLRLIAVFRASGGKYERLEPMEPREPTDPMDPMEPMEPTDPMEPIEP